MESVAELGSELKSPEPWCQGHAGLLRSGMDRDAALARVQRGLNSFTEGGSIGGY